MNYFHTMRMQLTGILAAGLFALVFAPFCGDLALAATVRPTVEDIRSIPLEVPEPGKAEQIVAKYVLGLISTGHFTRRRVDGELSEEWYDNYFSSLDPNRLFFLQSDIDEFKTYRPMLARLVRTRADLQMAYDVYRRYLVRLQAWALYAAEHVDDPFDYTRDEYILVDRKDEAWAASKTELEDVWRRRLKNSLLAEILDSEAELGKGAEEDAAERVDDGEGMGKEADGEKDAPLTVAEDVPGGKDDATVQAAAAKLDMDQLKAQVVKRCERYLIQRSHVEAIEILELFMSSLTRLYDPHSVYMAPDTEEDFDINMSLQFSGIGARLTMKDSYAEVEGLIAGGPAEEDGRLQPGDKIAAVAQDGEDVVDVVDMPLRKIVKLIRGEQGSRVFLHVLRGTPKPVVIDIVRGVVKMEDRDAQSDIYQVPMGKQPDVPADPQHADGAGDRPAAANGRMLVISLPSFYADFSRRSKGFKDYKSSTRDVRKLLEDAAEKGQLDGVILDLRRNGGGALPEAVGIAGLFISEGPIVQTRDIEGKVDKLYDPSSDVVYGGPLVVLVDKTSASASEIVAAALQDYGRAVIVGDASTHGKGTVQNELHLDRTLGRSPQFKERKPGAVKLTVRKYYRITGGSTQLRGVVSDIVIPSYFDHMELGEAELPHAMAWDELQPAHFEREMDVRPLLPELKRRSEQRRRGNEVYERRREDIDRYGQRRAMTRIPLAKAERIELRRQDETWAEKMRRGILGKKSKDGASEARAEKVGETDDLVLREALNVLRDLNELQAMAPALTQGEQKAVKRDGQQLEDELP